MGVIHTVRSGTRIENEIEIKRSRFITTLARTDSSDEARALINEVKADNPQARHNCSAFLIQVDGRDPHQHSSDDGEPSGTAGTPMIDALRLAGVWNVTAVVTRYFGGILLGGGRPRARVFIVCIQSARPGTEGETSFARRAGNSGFTCPGWQD